MAGEGIDIAGMNIYISSCSVFMWPNQERLMAVLVGVLAFVCICVLGTLTC